MEELIRIITEEAAKTSFLEWVAFLSSLLYIGLASKENALCWYPAMLASTLFLILFLQTGLYMKVPLRAYYLVMAFYGLYEWRKGGKGGDPLPIQLLPVFYHILGISACSILGIGAGYLLASFTEATLPYLDSLTTVFSLFTTFLMARKYLANWYYWIVIDGVSIYLYGSQGLYLTALLFLLFTGLAVWGSIEWNAIHFGKKAPKGEGT